MMRKSMRDKIAKRVKKIQQDKIEQDRLKNSRDYQPEWEGYKPERR